MDGGLQTLSQNLMGDGIQNIGFISRTLLNILAQTQSFIPFLYDVSPQVSANPLAAIWGVFGNLSATLAGVL